jgi:hypothetical protein
MEFDSLISVTLTLDDLNLIVAALDSYIRRKVRDYNHKERNGADRERLQQRQVDIEAAKELRELIYECTQED